MVSTRVLWRRKNILVAGGLLVVAAIFVLAACTGPAGPVGLTGPAGPTGPAGGAAPAAPPPKATALPADALKADYPDGVHLELKGLADEFRVKYSITIHNYTDKELANITINSPLPEASRFMEVTTTPEGAAVIGKPDKSVDWTLAKLAARSAIGPFEYKVSIPEREAGVVSATAKWESPTAGSVSASTLEFDKIAINLPKRGCPACHVLRDDKTGAVTIAYEAMHRGGPNHPK
ncbi:MAG: hypothetical protein HYX84_06800, partial [Chloroflexi bacterium]|nr:hypothetical protein [Chloroflexota bacterium]